MRRANRGGNTEGDDDGPAPRPEQPRGIVGDEEEGRSSEDTRSTDVKDYVPEGDASENAVEYLRRLVEPGRGRPQGDLTDREVVAVNDAFRSLQSRLGTAGRQCIQAYRRWGERFWQSTEKEMWDGLVMSYWHQISLAAGVRRRAYEQMNKEQLDIPYMPLLPTMVNAQTNEFDPSALAGDPGAAYMRPALRTEYGHFRSINRRIRQDADIQCRDNQPYFFTPCDLVATPKYNAWRAMVTRNATERSLKKSQNNHPGVELLFNEFLMQPNMVQWDNLISAVLLQRVHKEWLQKNAASLDGWEGARNFANRMTRQVYRDLWVHTYDNFARPNDRSTWFPPGYRGLVREFLGPQRTWEHINTIENANRPVPLKALDVGEEAFYRAVRAEADELVRAGEPLDELVRVPVDASIDRATKKAMKKARSKRAPRDASEEASVREDVLSQEIPFMPAPPGVRGPSLVTVQLLADQVANIGRSIARELPTLQASRNTQDATDRLEDIMAEFNAQNLVSEIANTYCAIDSYLADPDNDELYNNTLDQLERLQGAAYGVSDDVRMRDAPAAVPTERPDAAPPAKTVVPRPLAMPNPFDEPSSEEQREASSEEPDEKRGRESSEGNPRPSRKAANVMRVEEDTCSVQ